jgi:Ca2+-binding RTX toxin-like protein
MRQPGVRVSGCFLCFFSRRSGGCGYASLATGLMCELKIRERVQAWLRRACFGPGLFADARRMVSRGGAVAVGSWSDATLGTPDSDSIRGTPGVDRIVGFEGNDEIKGRGGFDVIYGGAGNDDLDGYLGRDKLFGEAGDDTVRGGPDGDLLRGGPGDDDLKGDAGNDRINGDERDDWIRGGPGDDVIDGGPGKDLLFGNDGDDTFYATYLDIKTPGSADLPICGKGNDVLSIAGVPSAERAIWKGAFKQPEVSCETVLFTP